MNIIFRGQSVCVCVWERERKLFDVGVEGEGREPCALSSTSKGEGRQPITCSMGNWGLEGIAYRLYG